MLSGADVEACPLLLHALALGAPLRRCLRPAAAAASAGGAGGGARGPAGAAELRSAAGPGRAESVRGQVDQNRSFYHGLTMLRVK